jgi:hypothetical protein
MLRGTVVSWIDQHWPRLAVPACAAVVALLLLTEYPHARPERLFAVDEAAYAADQIAARMIGVTTAGESEPAASCTHRVALLQVPRRLSPARARSASWGVPAHRCT